jgi:hypothetical protein
LCACCPAKEEEGTGSRKEASSKGRSKGKRRDSELEMVVVRGSGEEALQKVKAFSQYSGMNKSNSKR